MADSRVGDILALLNVAQTDAHKKRVREFVSEMVESQRVYAVRQRTLDLRADKFFKWLQTPYTVEFEESGGKLPETLEIEADAIYPCDTDSREDCMGAYEFDSTLEVQDVSVGLRVHIDYEISGHRVKITSATLAMKYDKVQLLSVAKHSAHGPNYLGYLFSSLHQFILQERPEIAIYYAGLANAIESELRANVDRSIRVGIAYKPSIQTATSFVDVISK
jgi:hypothetical protein